MSCRPVCVERSTGTANANCAGDLAQLPIRIYCPSSVLFHLVRVQFFWHQPEAQNEAICPIRSFNQVRLEWLYLERCPFSTASQKRPLKCDVLQITPKIHEANQVASSPEVVLRGPIVSCCKACLLGKGKVGQDGDSLLSFALGASHHPQMFLTGSLLNIFELPVVWGELS